jgi:hypothetical protein
MENPTYQNSTEIVASQLEPSRLTIKFQVTDVARPLCELEDIVVKGLASFMEVGRALSEIKKFKLYLQTHKTFEEYCTDRLKVSRQRAYQLIQASEVAKTVSTTVDIKPAHERQMRPLTVLPTEKQPEAWKEATSENINPTAQDVSKAVRKVLDADEIQTPTHRWDSPDTNPTPEPMREPRSKVKSGEEYAASTRGVIPEDERAEIISRTIGYARALRKQFQERPPDAVLKVAWKQLGEMLEGRKKPKP